MIEQEQLLHYQTALQQLGYTKEHLRMWGLMQRTFSTEDGNKLLKVLMNTYVTTIIGKQPVEVANYLNGASDLVRQIYQSTHMNLKECAEKLAKVEALKPIEVEENNVAN